VVDRVRTSTLDAGVNAGIALGRSFMGVNFAYSRQGLNGSATIGDTQVGAGTDAAAEVSGDVVSTSIGGSFSHSFGQGALTATPMLSVSYDRTRTSGGLTLRDRTTPVGIDTTSEGVSITPALSVTRQFSDSFSLTGSAAFTAVTDGAASRLGRRLFGSSTVQTGQQDANATQWGTLGLSASIAPTARFSILPSIGTTVGRSTNEIFGGTTLAVSF
jgi:hypothetical protein